MSRFVRLDEIEQQENHSASSNGGGGSGGGEADGSRDKSSTNGRSNDLVLDYETLPLRPTSSQVADVRKHGTLPFVAIVDVEESTAEVQHIGSEGDTVDSRNGARRRLWNRPRGGKVVLVGVISRGDLDDSLAPDASSEVDVEDLEQLSPCLERHQGQQIDDNSEGEDSSLLTLGGGQWRDDYIAKAGERLRQLMQATTVHTVAMHTSVGQLQLHFSRLGVELAYVVSAGALEGVVSSQQVALQPQA